MDGKKKDGADTGPEAASTSAPTNFIPVIVPKAKPVRSKKGEQVKTTVVKKIISVESQEQFNTVLEEARDKHVMVDFYATWCRPCVPISAHLDELCELYKDKVVIAKINVEELEDLAIEYNVTTLPAFIVIKEKKVVYELSGSKVEQYDEVFEKFLGKPE